MNQRLRRSPPDHVYTPIDVTSEHVVTISHETSTGTFTLDVDGTSATTNDLTIADNANNWEWGLNGSVVYFESIKLRRGTYQFATEFLNRAGAANTVALWVVDNTGTTLADSAGNGHTLTWSEPIESFDTAPATLGYGYSAVLNGTDEYGQTPDADDLSFNGSTDSTFSLMLLLRWEETVSTPAVPIAKADTGDSEWVTLVNGFFVSGLTLYLTDQSRLDFLYTHETTPLARNIWYLTTFTYDASAAAGGVRVYRDTTRVDDTDAYSDAGYVAMENLTSPVTLGARLGSGVAKHFWEGQIAFAAILSTELNTTTIASLYDLANDYYLGGPRINASQATTLTDAHNFLWYQLTSTPALTIYDRTGNGNTGYMSWPAHPSDLTLSVDALESTRAPETLTTGPGAASIVGDISTPSNLFGGETGASLPGGPLLNSMATTANLPTALYWTIIAGLVVTIAGVATVVGTTSLLMGVIVMGVAIAGFTQIGNGLLPAWVLFVYAPIAVALLTLKGTKIA